MPSWFRTEVPRESDGERVVFLTNAARIIGCSFGETKTLTLILYSTEKLTSDLIQVKIIKFVDENIREIVDNFLGMTQTTKPLKTLIIEVHQN